MKPFLKVLKYDVKTIDEEQEIADNLLRGNVVIADLSRLPKQHFELVVSFLDGVLFGIDSEIVYLRQDVLLLMPGDIYFENKSLEQGSINNLSMLH